MMRFLSIVVIVWGLIIQPLMAATPVQIADINVHSADLDKIADISSEIPCHEAPDFTESIDALSKHCAQCDAECSNAQTCASACVIGWVATAHKSVVNLKPQRNLPINTPSKSPDYGLLSRVFHPPKHS